MKTGPDEAGAATGAASAPIAAMAAVDARNVRRSSDVIAHSCSTQAEIRDSRSGSPAWQRTRTPPGNRLGMAEAPPGAPPQSRRCPGSSRLFQAVYDPGAARDQPLFVFAGSVIAAYDAGDGLGLMADDREQEHRRAVREASLLLPLLERPKRDSEALRKRGLR